MRSVIFILLCFAGLVQAQPQAPIEWGEGRWFGTQDCGFLPNPLAVQGDSLLLVTPSSTWPGGILAAYSHDDGRTCSPWQQVDSPQLLANGGICPVLTDGVACIALSNDNNLDVSWLRFSTDAGQTWGPVVQQRADVISCLYASSHFYGKTQYWWDGTRWQLRVSFSTDRGQSWFWQAPVSPPGIYVSYQGIALTRERMIISGHETALFQGTDSVFVASSNRQIGLMSDFALLLTRPQGYYLMGQCVAGDTASETAIILSAWERNSYAATELWINRSTDGGQSWDSGTCLEDTAYISLAILPRLFCGGNLWATAWRVSSHPDTAQRGMYCRFSANHGRAWYPRQRIDPHRFNIYVSTGQFVGDEIRVYWEGLVTSGVWDFRTVSGALRVDSLPPMIETVAYLDTLLLGGETVSFEVAAHDNDSLWLSQAVIRRERSPDSLVIPLVRDPQGEPLYRGEWSVPEDTADYLYYYHFEDMWENVAYAPEAGPSDPARVHVGPLLASDDLILHPSSFSLSVFPNPFNARTEIRFALPRAERATLTIYDLAGRRVALLADATYLAGEHVVHWNARGLPSGVYFARLNAGGFAATQKMVLLR